MENLGHEDLGDGRAGARKGGGGEKYGGRRGREQPGGTGVPITIRFSGMDRIGTRAFMGRDGGSTAIIA